MWGAIELSDGGRFPSPGGAPGQVIAMFIETTEKCICTERLI
jgi:hypothetical protein